VQADDCHQGKSETQTLSWRVSVFLRTSVRARWIPLFVVAIDKARPSIASSAKEARQSREQGPGGRGSITKRDTNAESREDSRGFLFLTVLFLTAA
jgi:hypothetical protein